MTQELTDLPAETVDVVSRWNPAATVRLVARTDSRHELFVAGPRRAGKTTLVDALRFLDESAFDLVDDPLDAGVVLMVLDAAAPLGREELAVLDVVLRPACPVVFALTKIDVHREWATVRERDRALLAGHAERFADVTIHPVAAGAGRAPARGSGVEALLEALLSAAGGQSRSARSSAERVLEQTRRMIVATGRSIREADSGADLRAERTHLLAHRDGRRAERVARLRSEVQLGKVELIHEVSTQIRAAGVTVRADIDRAGRANLADYPDRLADIVAQLGVDLEGVVTTRLDHLLARAGVAAPARRDTGPKPDYLVPGRPEPRHRGLEDRMTILIGASAGLGLGRLMVAPLSVVPALDIASVPLTLTLGGVVAWWLARARGHIAERSHVRQWASESLTTVRAQWEQRVLGRLLSAEAEISEMILEESRSRAQEVDTRVASIDGELRKLTSRRNGQLASCERDIAAIDRGLREIRDISKEPKHRPERQTT
ncbi:hypothetical protein CBI38_25430 [Rhodococcus oxybenzonivorans]|uniref:G domain-containing protein n=1 Tax=Rhodococcus oxybenzonivorans TaxID=1990687 RepID=A0A2S2C0J4_9NOCA|nr:hypothetical protein [Rhodococcus oxybenzonivorans]AWK74401.1 hypothetical protein CBI38_25430 [Rhodococcus oxybenzonivorans]